MIIIQHLHNLKKEVDLLRLIYTKNTLKDLFIAILQSEPQLSNKL